MPESALPEGFDNRQKGDWNIWPLKYIQPSWTAFGPRCTEWWARFRKYPITIFAVFGPGDSRWENDIIAIRSINKTVFWYNPAGSSNYPFYLSAIQYWCDWHIQLGWPLFFACHINTKTRTYYFRIGARRNADIFYDFPSAHLGDWN